jgi:hypothetical protein
MGFGEIHRLEPEAKSSGTMQSVSGCQCLNSYASVPEHHRCPRRPELTLLIRVVHGADADRRQFSAAKLSGRSEGASADFRGRILQPTASVEAGINSVNSTYGKSCQLSQIVCRTEQISHNTLQQTGFEPAECGDQSRCCCRVGASDGQHAINHRAVVSLTGYRGRDEHSISRRILERFEAQGPRFIAGDVQSVDMSCQAIVMTS